MFSGAQDRRRPLRRARLFFKLRRVKPEWTRPGPARSLPLSRLVPALRVPAGAGPRRACGRRLRPLISALIFAWGTLHVPADVPPVTDTPFPQEVARRVRFPGTDPAPALALVEIAPSGVPRFFGGGRWYTLEGEDQAVERADLRSTGDHVFTFPGPQEEPVTVPLRWSDVRQLVRRKSTTWIATAADPYQVVEGRLTSLGWPSRWEVRQIALDAEDRLWVASSGGLFRQRPGGWEAVAIPDGRGRGWAVEDVRGIALDSQGRPWVALPAGIAWGTGGDRGGWRCFEGRDGLPYADFTAVTVSPGGAAWFGTRLGAIRWDGAEWAYRQGPRWLPHDEIRGLACAPDGTVWFATSAGAAGLARRPMTLAEKAAHYEAEIERYIKRTPFGYTSEVGLGAPGDRSRILHSDSDNDGLWTAMYGAGECFAYAATGRPEFRQRATQVFEALRFLQTVTQGGPHSPPRGYVARTILPGDGPDPNQGRLEADRRIQAEGDRLWKVYEPRWPRSADGAWYWKSDTSSDELDGHYFFHARYYDLVADDTGKARVREVIRDLTDHLLQHGFNLVDHDGRPTRWAIFGPESLNHDPRWWVERGLNSLSLLSYLTVAEHITGDPKYGVAARELIDRHGYGANVMNPKTQSGPGSGNQSDDEMAFMCFYNLLQYTRDPHWRSNWLYAFHTYAALELPEMNPFFNFAYAAVGRGGAYRNPWGEFALDPWNGWLEDSLATLRGFPLDRVNWPVRNSHRLDLVLLPPQQSTDLYEPRQDGRGHRVNGKVLPVAERHFNHWNTDPWRLDYGGNGRELASGTVFLLPYYMGLHHGFITPPR